MGCTYRRGKTWWIKYFRNGRQNFESSGSQKKEDATNLLKLKEGDIARGMPVTAKIGQLKFEEARDDFLNERRINSSNPIKKLEARIANHLTPFFGSRRMANITTTDVRAYTAKRKAETILVRKARTLVLDNGTEKTFPEERRPVANATINRELTILKRVFSLAIQAEKLLRKPHIALLREDNTRTGFFEWEQYDSVLRHLPQHIRPAVTFAYVTGWRMNSEVLPMQWRQVDFKGGEVRLDAGTTKNREGRIFLLTAELRTLLEELLAEHRALAAKGTICPYVFQHAGRRVKAIRKRWKTACTAAGCPGRIPHDLRRTAVRNMVRAGIPERVAMKLTGHRTRSVFERYNIVSDGDLLDAARKLSGFLPASAQKAAN